MASGADRRRRLVLAVAAFTGTVWLEGCEAGGPASPFVIPGPTVPNPLPSSPPYRWDTREELEIWTSNLVSRGPLAINGAGVDAFIRIDPASADWVLRGPDLNPPAHGIQTVRVRYKWRPDPSLQPAASQTGHLVAYFNRSPAQPEQPAAHGTITPSTPWHEISFTPGNFRGPLDVDYIYLYAGAWNRGVFELDWIELVPSP
jgi:hypothetical protein